MAASRGARRGQAAVLIALCLFSLVIFLAMATNMGILVNDRIRMQNAADMGAYSAAYREAQNLNALVAKNEAIVGKVEECRDMLTSVPWPNSCDCQARSVIAERYIANCQAQIEVLASQFLESAAWTNSVDPALDAGMATMDANIPGLSSSGSRMVQGLGSASYRYGYYSDGTALVPSMNTIATYRRVNDTKFNYPVLLLCPTNAGCIANGVVPSAQTAELRTWYYKDDTNADIWVMAEASGTMRSTYLDVAYSASGNDGGYFGASSTGGDDRMVAIAVAKPFGGSIGPSPPSSSPAQRSGNTDPTGPYWTGRSVRFARLAMVDEYRARIAGVSEWDGSATATYEPRSALSLSSWGADAVKFRH